MRFNGVDVKVRQFPMDLKLDYEATKEQDDLICNVGIIKTSIMRKKEKKIMTRLSNGIHYCCKETFLFSYASTFL